MNLRQSVIAVIFSCIVFDNTPAFAQHDEALSFGIGAYNFEDSNPIAAELRLEYRPGFTAFGDIWSPTFGGIAPTLGLMANSEGAVFGYGALQADIFIADDWVVTPALGIGGYHRGSSLDLGGIFQFHGGLTLAYRMSDAHRLGVSFAHISNASIHRKNKSVNSLLVIYSVPLDDLF